MDDAQFRQWVREQEKPEKTIPARNTVTIERREINGKEWVPVFSLAERQAKIMLRQARVDARYVYRVRHDRSS